MPRSSVLFVRPDNNDILGIRIAARTIRIWQQLCTSVTSEHIERVEFSDGTIMTRAQMLQAYITDSMTTQTTVDGTDQGDTFTYVNTMGNRFLRENSESHTGGGTNTVISSRRAVNICDMVTQ